MSTAIFSEDTNTYNLCPSSKSEMVTKKRASFTDDIVISGVTITGQSFVDHHIFSPKFDQPSTYLTFEFSLIFLARKSLVPFKARD